LPTVKEHINKSKYNEKFFEDVKHDYPDWAVTGLFYAALHLVDAFLSKKGVSVEDHKTRSWYVASVSELKPIYGDYRAMYDYSVNARYKMHVLNVESLNDIYSSFYLKIRRTLLKYL